MKIENNKVCLVGRFVSDFEFSHETHGEKFYIAHLEVRRISETTDIIPIIASEMIIDRNLFRDYMQVTGTIRTYNRREENKTRLIVSVFTDEIIEADESQTNDVFLDGFICKNVIYRGTPLGREIADIILAVNRPYGKPDYIPCIAWGRVARYAARLEIGDRIRINGRIQSREYVKRVSETEYEKRIAYEVSIMKLERIEEEIYEN